MFCFEELFMEAGKGSVEYKGKTILLIDKFFANKGDVLIISIESTNSKYIQGVSLDIRGYCEVHGETWQDKKGVDMIFWEDAELVDPKHIEMKVFPENDYVLVQNIWERSTHLKNKIVDRGHNEAAMIVEEIENGKRYHCNDGQPDENFDDIIFTIQRIT